MKLPFGDQLIVEKENENIKLFPMLNPFLSQYEDQYSKKYCEEEQELIVLVEKPCTECYKFDDRAYAGLTCLSVFDCQTGTFSFDSITLCWYAPLWNEIPAFGFPVEPLTEYRVRIRKEKKETSFSRALLCAVLEKMDDAELRFNPVKQKYLKLPQLSDSLGTYTLTWDHFWFEGKIVYQKTQACVLLDVDSDDEDTANAAYATYKRITSDLDATVQCAVSYAAEEMTDLANDWSEDEREIDKSQFMSRLTLASIVCDNKGNYEIGFSDDDMFGGHEVVVSFDADGEFENCSIEG